jgi:hypothetical protein
MGVPNLPRCEDVLGFKEEGDQLYVSTVGHTRAVMDFSEPSVPSTKPWMVSCSGEVQFTKLESERIEGSIWDLRRNQLDIAGLTPGTEYQLTAEMAIPSPEAPTAQVDKEGHLRLSLPPVCGFVLTRGANNQAPRPSSQQ